jgi:hypothetical protein
MKSPHEEMLFPKQQSSELRESNAIGALALHVHRRQPQPEPDVDKPTRPDRPTPPFSPPLPDRRRWDLPEGLPDVGPEGPGKGHPGGGSEDDDDSDQCETLP